MSDARCVVLAVELVKPGAPHSLNGFLVAW